MKLLILMFILSANVNSEERSVEQLICQTVAIGSIYIQQIDDQGSPIPFDCKNIEVILKENNKIINHIKPAQYISCPSSFFSKSAPKKFLNQSISIWSEEPGTYQVIVSRFDETHVFNNIEIKLKESSCHTNHELLKVHFDITKQAKKSH